MVGSLKLRNGIPYFALPDTVDKLLRMGVENDHEISRICLELQYEVLHRSRCLAIEWCDPGHQATSGSFVQNTAIDVGVS